jgi:hypothetical protein
VIYTQRLDRVIMLKVIVFLNQIVQIRWQKIVHQMKKQEIVNNLLIQLVSTVHGDLQVQDVKLLLHNVLIGITWLLLLIILPSVNWELIVKDINVLMILERILVDKNIFVNWHYYQNHRSTVILYQKDVSIKLVVAWLKKINAINIRLLGIVMILDYIFATI